MAAEAQGNLEGEVEKQRGPEQGRSGGGRGVTGTGTHSGCCKLGRRGEGRGHLQVPAWYFRVLTLRLWAVNVRTRSPVSISQHLAVLSALPEYTCWFTSWGGGGEGRSALDIGMEGHRGATNTPACGSHPTATPAPNILLPLPSLQSVGSGRQAGHLIVTLPKSQTLPRSCFTPRWGSCQPLQGCHRYNPYATRHWKSTAGRCSPAQ